MKRRRLLLPLLLLLLLGGLLLVPQVRWPVYGWLRGEAFYQGMPTSYWRQRIQQYERPKDAKKQASIDDWIQKLESVFGLLADDLPLDILGHDPGTVAVRLELLQDSDECVRKAAILDISLIGPSARPAIPLLINLCEDPSVAVQLRAIVAVGQFGPEAKEALPSLRRLLELYDGSLFHQYLLRTAIRDIDPEAAARSPVK
jgi:HEAT repeat protein